MAYVYYTLTAIVLYLLSDWILDQIEQRVGKRLEYRSVVFFAIITVLALASFHMIDQIISEAPHTTARQNESPMATEPMQEQAQVPSD